MSRDIDSSTATAMESSFKYIFMVDLQLDSGDISFCSATFPIDYDNKTFLAAGNLGRVGEISESTDLNPASCKVDISGVNQTFVATIVAENYVNRRGIIYLAVFDEEDQIIGQPFTYFDGLIESLAVSIGDRRVVSISLVDRLVLWSRVKVERYSHETHTAIYPDDDGFEFVEAIQNKEIIWPTEQYLRGL